MFLIEFVQSGTVTILVVKKALEIQKFSLLSVVDASRGELGI
jgi:hypothetical protein